MRQATTSIALFIILAMAVPAFSQQPPPPPPPQQAPEQAPLPATREIIPGQSLAGVSIGGAIRLVITRFGRPSEIRETPVDTFYAFSRLGIGVYARGTTVSAVSTTNSLLSIEGKLGPGYRREDAIRMFGGQFREGIVEGFRGPVYDDRGIAFGIDGTTIAVVLVFRPGTAATVSGLLPAVVGPAQVPPSGFPNVAGLRPFSTESNYMSLPGYLRWLVFQVSGRWITYEEASRIVKDQQGG